MEIKQGQAEEIIDALSLQIAELTKQNAIQKNVIDQYVAEIESEVEEAE